MTIHLTNGLLFDSREGVVAGERDVIVEGDRIVDVGERLTSDGARRIDLRGRTLLPGLIDCHVHCTITFVDTVSSRAEPATLMAQRARLILEGMLRRGFTSVRDCGGADRGLSRAVELGLINGPRLFFAGRVLSATGGHGDHRVVHDHADIGCHAHTTRSAHVVDGPDGIRRAAREELRRGADFIKVMASGGVASPSDPLDSVQYSHEELAAAVDTAAGWHKYVAAHAYTSESVQRAVGAGVRTIEHGNLIDPDTATLMADNGAYLVPTLVTYHALHERGPSLGFPEVATAKLQEVLHKGADAVELALKAGVRIGFGTDLLGETHEEQSREFQIRAERQKVEDVVRAATFVNAEILKKEGELGVVEPGALADLVVVDGNPFDDVSLLTGQGEHLSLIMKNGDLVVDRL